MKTHLITGAGSGIGASIADALYDRDDRLVLVARSVDRGAELTTRWPGSVVVVADLADPLATEVAFEAAELPDLLDSVVLSAGIGSIGRVSGVNAAAWNDVLSVNLVSPAVVTRACLPAVRRAQGTVVFVNSGAGLTSGPGWSPYAASKFGLRAVADALRAEEQAAGVRVTTIYPGRVATPMQEALHEYEGSPYDPSQWIQPETVARAVLQAIDLTPDATMNDITLRPR
jgi:NAD(P)-dependent dehydrogenase (short-subunit alcohol dehydrogenase family)